MKSGRVSSAVFAACLCGVPAALDAQQKDAEPKDSLPARFFRIPGTDVAMAFGGYAKVDVIQDLDAIGDAFEFRVNSIPVEGTPAADQSGRTTLSARETRINLELRAPTPRGRLRAFVEGDFFGDRNAFRMRHAYGEFGRVLGGQTWTTFMDISARPLTIDFEGPDAELFVRQSMIRYTWGFAPGWTWAAAVEDPNPQFVVPAGLTGTPRANLPDLPSSLRYQKGPSHIQLAGILRRIRFDGESGSPDLTTTGWGLSVSFKVRTFERDELMGQLAHGSGVARYIETFNGQNSDAVITSANQLEPLDVTALVLGYTHFWKQNLKSGLSFGLAELGDNAALPTATMAHSLDARVNLLWTPFHMVDYGVETLWGRRENVDGARGDAWRVQFTVIFRFS